MAQDKFQLHVHPWREVLLVRATGYPLFIISMLRFTFAITAIGRRRAKYNYAFQHRDSNGPGIFAYPQPVSDEHYVDYGLAQFDGQAHAVESLLYVYMALSLVDWFPSWILARYRHNPVWANGWTSRFVILAHALVPAVHLAIAIVCQVIFAALVHDWLSSPRIRGLLDRWEELGRQPWEPSTPLPPDLPPPPPPPPRGDYISKNPKEQEIDPVVTCVLAFVVLSAIDAFIRWAKLLVLRVFPTSCRYPDSITVCHRPVPSESLQCLEEDRKKWNGPVAAMFEKQQNRRLSFGRPTTQAAVQSPGNATTTPSTALSHGQLNSPGNIHLAPILLRDGLRIPREYQKLFLHYFVGYMQWEIVVGFSTIGLVLNTIYLVLLQRFKRVCNSGCIMGVIYPSWWLLTLLCIAAIIRFRIPFQRVIWRGTHSVCVVHLIALCFWIGTILLLVGLVLMVLADDFFNRSENDGAIVGLNIGRVMLLGIWITLVYIYPPWRRYFRK